MAERGRRMNTITKKNFIADDTRILNGRVIVGVCALVLYLGLRLWLGTEADRTRFFVIAAVLAVVIIGACILLLCLKKKMKKRELPSAYIVEDVFIRVRKKEIPSLHHANTLQYTLTFSRSGDYTYLTDSGSDRKEPEDPGADYSAVHFSRPGDKVYLVISERSGKILRCFNARYYRLCEEDFTLADGKYRCRN